MSGYKRRFPCGHSGHGQYCHRCEQEANAEQARIQRSEAKAAWSDTFAADPVDLRFLPRELVAEARAIFEGIGQGRPYQGYKGKRLRYDRDIVSVPLGRDHRILLQEVGDTLVPMEVMSHETYNRKKPGQR